MKHAQYSWSTSDGIEVFAQSWSPDGKAKAVVALVHGLGEHSGRYPLLVEKLPAAGYAINGYDLRGHGKTGGPRLYASSFDVLADDVGKHIEQTRQRFPGLPMFLYGHSMGGEQVLYYVLRHSPSLAGVVATSPLLAPGTPTSSGRAAVARFLARLVPKNIIPTQIPWDSLSRDQAVIDWTKKDPLCQEGVSLRLGMEVVRAGEWISRQSKFPLPLLVLQGTGDQHVSPQKTIAFAKQLTGDVTLKIFEDGRHELHNDLDREKVATLVLDWMGKHLAA
ncbi:MAG TPA: lysophospholipase [Spirochaetia bacterium]|nr:lysophospholipase [Spirochaetia bacterium]